VPILDTALISFESLREDQMLLLEKVTTIIIRKMEVKEQVAILRRYMSHFVPTILDSDFVFPLVALVCNIRPELEQDINAEKILNILICSPITSVIRKSYVSKCIASVVNKFSIGIFSIKFYFLDSSNLELIVKELKQKIFNESMLVGLRQDSVLIYSWITKSIILTPRLNRMGGLAMLADLINLHEDLDICHVIPEAIDIIISDDSYLSRDSFCRISVCRKLLISRSFTSKRCPTLAFQY
jgi:hypothetical protein